MNLKIFSKIALVYLLVVSPTVLAKSSKWYHVEILIFEMQNLDAQEWSSDLGKPSLSGTIPLSSDPTAEFGQLADNALVLHNAKKRLQRKYNLVLHKGWRQMLSDKEHAQKIHLKGAITNTHEVDGTVLLSLGRNIYIDTDLLLQKFNPNSQEKQLIRFTESSKIRPDEMTYIDHPRYGIIVMVIPETPLAQKAPAQKT